MYVEEYELSEEVKLFYAKERLAPVLGSEGFMEQVSRLNLESFSSEVSRKDKARRAPNFQQIIDVVCQVYSLERSELLEIRKGRGIKNFPRKVAMYVCQLKGQYKLTEIAEHFGLRHYGGVSSAISAVKHEAEFSRQVQRKINGIINRLDR